MAWRYEDRGTAQAAFADPHQAFEDVRKAHAWATAELPRLNPVRSEHGN